MQTPIQAPLEDEGGVGWVGGGGGEVRGVRGFPEWFLCALLEQITVRKCKITFFYSSAPGQPLILLTGFRWLGNC